MKHFSRRRVIGVSLMLLGIIFFVIGFFCESYNKKPLDYVVLNVNEEINLDIFFDYDYKNANFITDVLDIDTSKLGVYDVEISLNERIFLSKLEIVDVEAPIVDVKDLKLSFYSELTPDMFIEKIEDDTECSVKFEKDFVKKDGLQNVTIIVEDSAGNVTRKIATLDLAKVKEEVVIEAGSSFDVNSVIYGAEFVEDLKIIKNINVNKLGEQDLVININGEELIVKVIVKDTKAPVVTKKDVTIWWDQKIGSIDSFIRNVTDVTEVKKEYLTNINYSKIGTQTVKIRVTDTSGNYVDLDVKLTIKKDTKAPSINNLSKLVITRGSKPNYTKNVKAVDDHDGNLSFTYDDSSVDYNNVGTYYVVYKAVDKSGNKKTSKREVVVMGNRKDVEEKLRPIVSSITSSSYL